MPGPEVVVIGGVNVDIKSRATGPLLMGTSNPGATSVAAGGVGRNVAEVLARLGVRTALVSAIGDDSLGSGALTTCVAAGVDVSAVCAVPGAATGTYHAVLDEHGGLAVAVSDMTLTDALDASVVEEHADRIVAARYVVLDANLPGVVIAAALALAARHGVAVAIEPVSVTKAARVAALLDERLPVALVTPNRDELVAMTDTDDIDTACTALHARGVGCVSVRLGERGTFVAPAGERARLVGTRPVRDVVDVTGAGDSALAGHLWAVLHRRADPFTASRAGNATARAVLLAGGIAGAPLDPVHLDALVAELEEHR